MISEPGNGWWRRIVADQAATATEYAVMLTLILLACIVIITQYGQNLGSKYVEIDSELFP